MGVTVENDADRRLDPRMAPSGRVWLSPPPPASPLEGRLVDVSAGGVRIATEAVLPPGGEALRVEICLEDPQRPSAPLKLRLDGTGRVVWTRHLGDEGRQAGVQFDAPLAVRRPFPEVQIF